MTPGLDPPNNGFSPADLNHGSPDYYASPNHYNQSPDQYKSNVASPLYKAANFNQNTSLMSPIYTGFNASPIYNQNSPIRNPNQYNAYL
jgi:hypothetical protein